MIEERDWKWFGNVGHLCVGDYCRFHLATQVGEYFISTVGEYVQDDKNKRGQKEFSEYPEYIGNFGFYQKDGETLIGYYETMVFKILGYCSQEWCGRCGRPDYKGGEGLDWHRYSTAKEANEGHMEACKMVARGEIEEVLDESGKRIWVRV